MGPQQKPPVTTVPALKQWSDIIYLPWMELHTPTSGTKVSDLKYIMRTPCVNPTTQLVVTEVLKRTGKQLGPWPGATFSADTKEGNALMGTPNGHGVGFMLVQHKKQLGNKVVEKITVFQDAGKKQPRPPSLLFHIKDTPPQW
jgi:hypothetical protein